MVQRIEIAAVTVLLVALGVVACGGDDEASGATDRALESASTLAVTTAPPSTTTSPSTTTTAASTTTATTTMTTTTTTTTTLAAVDPSLPTYSEVIAAHWSGADLCGTQAGISGGPEVLQFGPFGDEGAVTSIQEGFPMGFCPGARYIVAGELTLAGGDDFAIGTLLTLDSDLNFVAVSSWD